MSFINPQLFWILILPLLFFALVILRHKDKMESVFSEDVMKRLRVDDDTLPLIFRNTLLLLALFFMLISLAQPVLDRGDEKVELKGLSALLALDISGSMRSQDIYPNRLEFAKNKIGVLLEVMPNDEFSLIAFAHSAFMLAPFSSDKMALKEIVDGVDDKYINMSSTDFKALADYSAKVLKEKKEKILILFSDGGEEKAVEAFAKVMEKEKISLYVVLIGTLKGSAVINASGKSIMKNGRLAISKRNDSLGAVAMNNHGAYVVANSGDDEINTLVASIKEHHKSIAKGEVVIQNRVQLFYYFLAFGLVLLLFGFGSLPQKHKNI